MIEIKDVECLYFLSFNDIILEIHFFSSLLQANQKTLHFRIILAFFAKIQCKTKMAFLKSVEDANIHLKWLQQAEENLILV